MDRLAVKAVVASREIQLNSGEVATPHTTSNRISSGKFTVLTFLPRTLAEILIQPSSLWFLLVVVLEANPFGQNYECSYTTAVLLAFLLLLKLAKAAAVLRKYAESDAAYNGLQYQVWELGGFKTRASADLRVGNVLLLKEGERVPADMVLLSSPHGSCYFNTQRPLGESSLVLKTAVPPTYRFLQRTESDFNLSRFYAQIKIPLPNVDFASFSGSLKLPSLPRTVPLKPDHFLLRGGLVRGEEWILAVVVYAGKETKFWSNARSAAISLPCIERKLNYWVLAAAVVTAVISGVHLLVQNIYSQESIKAEDFLHYLLLYENLVPVVLYIAIEVLRLLFAILSRDKQDCVQVSFNTALDDLGSTQYILADKTGTVTRNELELVAVLLGPQMYTKIPLFGPCKLDTIPASEDERPTTGFREIILTFDELKRKMELNVSDELQRFCECVTLCNSIVIQKDNTHLATSADEAALMRGAQALGFELVSRGREECDIVYFDMCHSYRVLCVKKFTPDVKRMRILVQQEMDDFATLYIKGAYAVMKDMIVMSSEERAALERRIKEMEQKGLRTMVLCYRQLEGEDLADVSVRAINAMSASLNVEGKLEVLLQELERELCYLGVTGVLDHVQPDTADMIAELAAGGVTTWLLSGEGESNTQATAYQLGMLVQGTPVLSLRGLKRAEDCNRRLIQLVSELLQSSQTESSLVEQGRFSHLLHDKSFQDHIRFALSIDSDSFVSAISHSETQRLLLSLLLLASTCCFNSLTPGHKRQIAALMHANVSPSPILLAIGDEASEIPLLRETNIGAGVLGSDAAAVSDLVVSSFTRLGELLLTQGRKATALVAQTTLLFLYAQVLYAMAGMSFACVANFTAYIPVEIQGKALYTAVFTFFPILYVGSQGLKQQDSEDISKAELQCLLNRSFSLSSALRTLLLALLHYLSIVTFLFPAFYSGPSPCITTAEQGVMLLFTLVCTVNIHCVVQSTYITIPFGIVTAVSTALPLVVTAGEDIGTLEAVATTPRLLLGVIGAALWGWVVSKAFTLYFHMRDIKPFLFHGDKVIPMKGHISEIRKIKRRNAQIRLSSKQTPSEITPESFQLGRKGVFHSPTIESDFQRFFLSTNFPVLVVMMACTLGIAVMRLVLELVMRDEEVDIAFSATFIAVCGVALLVYASRRMVTLVAWGFALGAVALALTMDIITKDVSNNLYFYVVAAMLLFLREKWIIIFPLSMLSCLFLTASMTSYVNQYPVTYRSAINAVGTVLVLALIQTVSSFHCYRNAKSRREKFALLKQSEERVAQSDSVLAVLLPDFVRKQVRDGFRYIAEDKGQVSVIFIDICHFDEICANYAPQELVALLDDIFLKIDTMCDSLNVAKIETVGKTYLACAGLRDFEFESTGEYIKIPHAKRCLDLAFAILSSFRNYPLQINQHLEFHIGINTGEVIAGVVGFHKPQFSLVGDTVNTASRMSSTLTLPNTIQISSSTYLALTQKSDYEFEARLVPVKGKGDMQTYVVKRANFTKRLAVQPEQEEIVIIPHQRSSIRGGRGSAAGRNMLLTEIHTANEKKLKEKVSFFAWKSNELEVKFGLDLVHMGCIKLSLVLFPISTMAMFMSRLILEVYEIDHQPVLVLVYFLATLSALICRIFLPVLIRRNVISWVLITIYSMTAIACSVDHVYADGLPMEFTELEVGFTCVLAYHFSALFFRHAVVVTGVLVLPVATLWAVSGTISISYGIFLFLFGVENCVFHYFMELNQRRMYNASAFAMREIEKTEQLLTQMMPVHAYESLKHAEWSTDKLLGVSILYADIAGFTAWSSQHQPHEVIEKLSKIFTLFDKICVKQGLYKVHTIGDCYVALSSTTNAEVRLRKEESVRMVSAALDMVRAVDEVCRADHEQLKMRIGVHAGDVVAGITGSRLVRYDIYGPDVLIGNKMESSGKEGKVNVSAAVKALLEAAGADFRFELNKTVEVPDLAVTVDSYFVSSPVGLVRSSMSG